MAVKKKYAPSLTFVLGGTRPKIAAQLRKQGWRWVDKTEAPGFEKDLDAITRLRTLGYISASSAERAEREVLNRIRKVVEVIPK